MRDPVLIDEFYYQQAMEASKLEEEDPDEEEDDWSEIDIEIQDDINPAWNLGDEWPAVDQRSRSPGDVFHKLN